MFDHNLWIKIWGKLCLNAVILVFMYAHIVSS